MLRRGLWRFEGSGDGDDDGGEMEAGGDGGAEAG